MVQLSAMPILITVGDVAAFTVPMWCHRFFNENRRRVTADVNTVLVEAECETGDANHRRETNCMMHLLPNCIWLCVKVNWHFSIAHPGTMNVTPTAFLLRGWKWEMKMNAFYFTVGLLRSTDNHNSLPQRHSKSLHHAAVSETAVFSAKNLHNY